MGILLGISGLANSGKDTIADTLVKDFSFTKMAFADEIKRTAMRWWAFSTKQLWGPSEERNKPDERYLLRKAGNYYTCTKCCVKEFGTSSFEVMTIGILRPMDCQLCGINNSAEHIHLVGLSAKYLTPRSALQKIGTEVARQVEPDVWARYTLDLAQKILKEPNLYRYTPWEGLCFEITTTPGRCGMNGVVLSDTRFLNEVQAIKEAGGLLLRVKRPEAGLDGEAAKHASEAEQAAIPDSMFDYIIDNNGTLDELRTKVLSIVGGFDLQFEPRQLSLKF